MYAIYAYIDPQNHPMLATLRRVSSVSFRFGASLAVDSRWLCGRVPHTIGDRRAMRWLGEREQCEVV